MGLVPMRHAHTDWNGPPARVQGQRDPGLSMVGRMAAEALGPTLPRPDRIIRSPARRCRETVDALFGAALPPVTEDAHLWEISLGSFEGRLAEDIAREEPEAWRAWRQQPSTARPGGGETLDELAHRVFAALDETFGSMEPNEEILVVGHGVPLRFIVCLLDDRPLDCLWDVAVANLGRIELPEVPRLC